MTTKRTLRRHRDSHVTTTRVRHCANRAATVDSAQEGPRMADSTSPYPVTLEVDYPDRDLNRLSTFFRVILFLPRRLFSPS